MTKELQNMYSQSFKQYIYSYRVMQVKNTIYLYLVGLIISFGSFVFGYSIVCMSIKADSISAIQPMKGDQVDYQLSIITTLLPLGAFIGTFLMRPLCQFLGQRKAMIVLDAIGICAILFQASWLEFSNIYIGRFIVGIYCGIATGIIPTYLISISPPEISGIIGSFNQLLITIGIAVAYGLVFTNLSWFQYMALPALFCGIRLVFCLFIFPFDTLERHYRQKQTDKLEQYINLFYDNGSLDQLVQLRKFTSAQQKLSQKQFNPSDQGIWKWIGKITSNAAKKVVILGFILALANQFSGINAIIFYANQVFLHITKNNKESANLYTVYLGVLQVVVTFISGFLINRFGRRSLMLVGETIIVFSLISSFLVDHIIEKNELYITIFVFLHIIGFSLSLGPVSMLYVAEMTEDMTFAICLVWIFTLFVSMVSEIMIKNLGIGNTFLFYGLISLFCLSYLFRNMVQSKGLSRKQLINKITKQQQRVVLNWKQETDSEPSPPQVQQT